MCIVEGRFYFTAHALTQHTLSEGFRAEHAVEAIRQGTIIERRDDEGRCLICGAATGLQLSPRFISTYIHAVVRWDLATQVVIITMYRPQSSEWINQFTRRRS